jgi:hypothetical protein
MATRNPPQTSTDPSGEGIDKPEADWGPAIGAEHGSNHARRPVKTEAERGQGRRTVQRNKEIAKGGLYKG